MQEQFGVRSEVIFKPGSDRVRALRYHHTANVHP